MSETIDQPTAAPTRKVASGVVAGAISVILIYLLETIFNIVLPSQVVGSATVLITFATSYLVKESV